MPLTGDALVLLRKSGPTCSAGVDRRPMGFVISSSISAWKTALIASSIGVWTAPRLIALIRMPCWISRLLHGPDVRRLLTKGVRMSGGFLVRLVPGVEGRGSEEVEDRGPLRSPSSPYVRRHVDDGTTAGHQGNDQVGEEPGAAKS